MAWDVDLEACPVGSVDESGLSPGGGVVCIFGRDSKNDLKLKTWSIKIQIEGCIRRTYAQRAVSGTEVTVIVMGNKAAEHGTGIPLEE